MDSSRQKGSEEKGKTLWDWKKNYTDQTILIRDIPHRAPSVASTSVLPKHIYGTGTMLSLGQIMLFFIMFLM